MTTTRTAPSKIARFNRLNPFRTRAAATIATLVLLVAAATTMGNAQTYADLYNFDTGPNDPRWSGVIAQGRDGNMYTTTPETWSRGLGDVIEITPTGTVTVLHKFDGTNGETPFGGLTLATDGKFYGTTAGGGSFGYGTIFSITAAGSLTTLYSFTNGADGSSPTAPPIEGLEGNFYGTTYGTDGNYGSVYKITPSRVFTTLHSFVGSDGANPAAPLLQGSGGDFWGTTLNGGTYGGGTIFRISASGKFDTVFNFDSAGGNPIAPIIQGSDGNFYGITLGGFAFRIDFQGCLRVLHTFTGGSDGGNQVGGLVQATDGNFYGTNNEGGSGGQGTIFRVSSTRAFATLYEFDDFGAGGNPQVTLLQHTNGVLYGTTAIAGTFDRGVFYSFDVGLGPFVSFLPAAGGVGRTIDVLGQGFKGTTGVSFNGTPAKFEVSSDTYLTATVPAGATDGFVTVTTPGGTLTSNKEFLVKP